MPRQEQTRRNSANDRGVPRHDAEGILVGYSTTTRFPTICPDFQYFEVGDIRSSIGEGPNSFVASRGLVVSDSCNS
ncbi:hypothetical protein DPMN_054072 [Dreissena polymorpha]|uniref:Uncharacterized protein n=1 Tax=Dreissena polymorpha TaxID=45954 RepID=A0A9D4HRA7_DREPO|nr:hypothetical protein DPMN_054072 [Dreissena polymorpha]